MPVGRATGPLRCRSAAPACSRGPGLAAASRRGRCTCHNAAGRAGKAAAGTMAAVDLGVDGSGSAGGAAAVLRLLGCDESQALLRLPSFAAAYLTRSGTAAGVNGGGASGSGLALRGGVLASRGVLLSDVATAFVPALAAGCLLGFAFCTGAALRATAGPPAASILSLLSSLLTAEHTCADGTQSLSSMQAKKHGTLLHHILSVNRSRFRKRHECMVRA